MLGYVIKRLLIAIPTLIGITLVSFLVISLAPGDPAQAQAQGIMDPEMSNRVYEKMRKQYNLDLPIHERYLRWLGKIVVLDFGESMSTDNRPVLDKIAERVWPTASLAGLSILLSLVLAVPIGVYCAARQNKMVDSVSSVGLYALYSVPSYVMAVPLILIVGVQLDWLPFQGMESDNHDELTFLGRLWDSVSHYLLILICFTYGSLAYYSRFVRQNMLEVLRSDFVRTARAKGLNEMVVLRRHAFRNTMIPMLTLLGLILPSVLGGSVILEYMFNWPGLGRLFFESMQARDYTTIMALNLISAVLVLFCMLLADLSYAWADPRVKYE
ncbi:MAG: ABC transporter permease [Planctomycetota bacterium]|jgi:peptide/nickel transport system permease protein